MYNSKLICTYSYYDPILRNTFHFNEKFDLDDVEEFAEMSEFIYQSELLQIWGYEKQPENVELDTKKMIEIYNQIKVDLNFITCIEKAKETYICEDLESAFICLFSYDYLFLTHKCICDFLNTGLIRDENITALKNAIK